MVAETYQALGLSNAVREHVEVKERARGFTESEMVESFCLLLAAGGECLDDFEALRADAGLAEMVGHKLPSPEAARQFLYKFHDEEEEKRREEEMRKAGEKSYVPKENAALGGLAKVNRELVRRVQKAKASYQVMQAMGRSSVAT